VTVIATAVLRVVEPFIAGLSLDKAAETIRRTYAEAGRGSMEASLAYLAVGRVLVFVRAQLPSDRLFGRWRKRQQLGFNRQRAEKLRWAAEHEVEVLAVLTSQLAGGRIPNIDAAVDSLRKRPGLAKFAVAPEPKGLVHDACIRHLRHPYTSNGYLCICAGDDPDESVALADYLARVKAERHDAELARPKGDGKVDQMPAKVIERPPEWLDRQPIRHEREGRLKHREKLVARRYKAIAAFDAAIAEDDDLIAQLDARLAKADAEIARLQAQPVGTDE